jgi:hypothetical protein
MPLQTIKGIVERCKNSSTQHSLRGRDNSQANALIKLEEAIQGEALV